MEKKKLVLVLTVVVCLMGFACFCNDKLEVRPNEIENIFFHVYKSLGAVKGYVIFHDENGNMRSTEGNLSLKLITTEIDDFRTFKGSQPDVKIETKRLRTIYFKPSDFEFMKLKGGDEIYALPITLGGSNIRTGDIILFKWRSFERKKAIREF